MASGCMEWPKATSRHHPSKVCVPASSVVSNNSDMPIYVVCQRRAEVHFGEDIPLQNCMCSVHSREAAWYLADPEYIPTWKREEHSQSVAACMYPECTATSTEERVITHSCQLLEMEYRDTTGLREYFLDHTHFFY